MNHIVAVLRICVGILGFLASGLSGAIIIGEYSAPTTPQSLTADAGGDV